MNEIHNRLKRGDVRDDGRMFWNYDKGYKNGERLVTPKFFDVWKKKEAEAKKRRRLINKKSINESIYRWHKNNKEKSRAIRKRYRDKKRASDPLCILCDRLRTLTSQAFRVHGYTKKSRTYILLGCSWEFLKRHIENQFTNGMNWENRHLWHIDHIVPLASAKSQIDLEKLFLYSNLQPLWASDNIRKRDKMPKAY